MGGSRKVGFLVNPKSGYGILMNMPGSDLIESYDPAKSHSGEIARTFAGHVNLQGIEFLTAGGYMGENALKDAGATDIRVIHTPDGTPTRNDTMEFIRKFNREDPELLVFFGGDGTACDISSAINPKIPVIGVPSGVKMHSSVFAVSPGHAAAMYTEWKSDGLSCEQADVVDADEDEMLRGRIVFSVRGSLMVPVSSHMLLSSKREYQSTDVMGAVEYIIEKMEPDIYYIIGSGSTCKAITTELGYNTPFYGADIVLNKKLVSENADAEALERCASGNRTKLVLTPIGGQGFVVGRGNRQVDDRVLRHIRNEDITVVASPDKLRDLEAIVVQSEIWKEKWIRVLYDYGRFKMVKVIS